LYGVQRLQIGWQHDIGVRTGLTANFLQPWYNKPVEIEISGESYIGMFGGQTLASILAQQPDDKKKQTDIVATINKGLKSVEDAIVKAGKSVLDSIKFPGLSVGMQNMKFLDVISKYNIDLSDLGDFLGVNENTLGKFNDLPMWKVFEQTGKSAENYAKFLANNCEQWGKKNLPAKDQRKNITKENLTTKTPLSDAVRKALTLIKQSLGPKEDKTVYNLKRLISYYRSGPFNYKGTPYKNISHVLLIENEQGMGLTKSLDGSVSGESTFSTFIGYIRDFNYIESVENPFVYEYTVHFIGLPDAGTVLTNSKDHAKVDAARGGITITVNPMKDILSQGLGLLGGKIPSLPNIPKIPGL
jgi:hypothetical protein